MTKRITEFRRVSFDWMIPVEERQQVESLLKTLGYEVDGGGTNLDAKTAEIYIRPKKRVRRRGASGSPADLPSKGIRISNTE